MSELEKVPPTVPVSAMSKRSEVVFEQIKKSHVLITRQGREAGVLVHPTVWNRLVDYIDELECLVAALEVERDIVLGKTKLIPLDPDTWEVIDHATEEAKPNQQKAQVLA